MHSLVHRWRLGQMAYVKHDPFPLTPSIIQRGSLVYVYVYVSVYRMVPNNDTKSTTVLFICSPNSSISIFLFNWRMITHVFVLVTCVSHASFWKCTLVGRLTHLINNNCIAKTQCFQRINIWIGTDARELWRIHFKFAQHSIAVIFLPRSWVFFADDCKVPSDDDDDAHKTIRNCSARMNFNLFSKAHNYVNQHSFCILACIPLAYVTAVFASLVRHISYNVRISSVCMWTVFHFEEEKKQNQEYSCERRIVYRIIYANRMNQRRTRSHGILVRQFCAS